MMRTLAIAFSVLLMAGAAFGQSQWPASKVVFDDTETLQEKLDGGDLGPGSSAAGHTVIAHEAIPGAPSNPEQLYMVADAAGACDISTSGSARALISWNGAAWVTSCDGASAGAETNDLEAAAANVEDDEVFVGTGSGTGAYRALSTCTSGTETLRWTGSVFACDTITGGGGTVDGITADTGGTTTGATVTLNTGTGLTTTRSTDTVTISIDTAGINATHMATASVGSLEIIDQGIGVDDLGNNVVDGANVIDGSLGLADLAAAARPAFESGSGTTKTRTDTDDLVVGEGQADGDDALLFDVSNSALTLNGPADGSGAKLILEPPEAVGSVLTVREGSNNGVDYVDLSAPPALSGILDLDFEDGWVDVDRRLLWDSDTDASWGAAETDVYIGGAGAGTSAGFSRLVVQLEGFEFNTATGVYLYLIDEAGTVTAGNSYEGRAEKIDNAAYVLTTSASAMTLQNALYGFMTALGYVQTGLATDGTGGAANLYGWVNITLPTGDPADRHRFSWEFTALTSGYIAARGTALYNAAMPGGASVLAGGIMIQTNSGSDTMDLTNARARVWGIK